MCGCSDFPVTPKCKQTNVFWLILAMLACTSLIVRHITKLENQYSQINYQLEAITQGLDRYNAEKTI